MRTASLAGLAVSLLVATTTAAAADNDPLYACKPAAASSRLRATFQPDTSIMDLVAWVTGFTCKNVVVDSEVKARVPRVTVVAPKEMTPKQALALFVDAIEVTGLTVQVKKDTILIKLGPKMPHTCPSVADASAPSSPPIATPAGTDTTGPSDDEIAKKIDAGVRRIDDTHVQLAASVVDLVLANPMAVAKGARVVPAIKNGKPDGFKLYAIRPSSIFAKLGFMNGDTLRTINGFELTSADKALEVYTKLREATNMTIEIDRRGKPLTLTISIK